MKIEIVSTEIHNLSGVSKHTQKPYSINKQSGFMHLDGERYPVRVEFNIADGATAWPVGFYSVLDSSFTVDRFGGIGINSELKLVPLKSGA